MGTCQACAHVKYYVKKKNLLKLLAGLKKSVAALLVLDLWSSVSLSRWNASSTTLCKPCYF